MHISSKYEVLKLLKLSFCENLEPFLIAEWIM